MEGYLHQDWDIAGPNDTDVIRKHRERNPTLNLKLMMMDIDDLIQSENDAAIEEMLQRMGCEYDYRNVGYTAKQWLLRLRHHLR